LGNISRRDQSVLETHLPKLVFELGFTVLLNTFSALAFLVIVEGRVMRELWSLNPMPGKISGTL
jgi:hypothetical protein